MATAHFALIELYALLFGRKFYELFTYFCFASLYFTFGCCCWRKSGNKLETFKVKPNVVQVS